MKVKIKLKKQYDECYELKNIVTENNLTIKDLFITSSLLKEIDNTDTNTRRLIKGCTDVIEIIVDRENDKPI